MGKGPTKQRDAVYTRALDHRQSIIRDPRTSAAMTIGMQTNAVLAQANCKIAIYREHFLHSTPATQPLEYPMPLTREAFARGTRRIGAEYTEYDQADLAGRAYMARGVCRSLSIVWVRNQKLLSLNQARARGQMEEISWLAEQQHQGNSFEITELFLRANGLTSDGSIFFRNRVDPVKLWFFLQAKPAFYLIGADAPGGIASGHEIAMSTLNAFKLFDANFGEVTFDTLEEMKNFYDQYWPLAYPDLTLGGGSIFRYR